MKRCPTCNQTFEEEWLSFCTQDGTTLIDEPAASNEPPATIVAPFQSASLPNAPASWNPPEKVSTSPPQWQPPAPTPWQPPPPPAYSQQQSKSLAMAAMIIGIISITIGWLCLGPVPAILAIILGGVALSQIKKNPERIGGRQAAWVGIVTGSITVVIYAIFMIIYIIALVANS
ncbi:MAG TPA: DUF4190 domain-containing protein [Pyrinomonadaceae bacterium]